MNQSEVVQLETSIECVLFDLDGTLIDTAKDFHIAVNKLLAKNNSDPISAQLICQTVSDGSGALVKLAFGIDENDPHYEELNQQLLELYFVELENTQAALYPGMDALLTALENHGVHWGIVTNKPEKYTLRLLAKLGLLKRCKSLVCPDHVSQRKPHPEPILLACQQLGVDTERTVFLGDHLRDIQAAKNADVIAVAAAYGYLAEDSKAEEWYADFILAKPDQAITLLNLLKFA
jgi:2-phosphoglycolate phosphatase